MLHVLAQATDGGGFSLPVWVNVLLALFGLAGTAGGLAAFFRVALSESTITQLKENNSALREDLGIQESRVTRLERDNDRLTLRVQELEQTNAILQDLVRGTNELADFQRQILEVGATQSEEHAAIMAAIGRIDRGA